MSPHACQVHNKIEILPRHLSSYQSATGLETCRGITDAKNTVLDDMHSASVFKPATTLDKKCNSDANSRKNGEESIYIEVEKVWAYWVSSVVKIPKLYNRTPKLTTSPTGRLHYIRNALVFSNTKELCLAIDGAVADATNRNQLHNTLNKSYIAKNILEPQYIFRNRQTVDRLVKSGMSLTKRQMALNNNNAPLLPKNCLRIQWALSLQQCTTQQHEQPAGQTKLQLLKSQTLSGD